MRQWRTRVSMVVLAALASGCGTSVRNVISHASEGRVQGLVLAPDGSPLTGVSVTAVPPSNNSPGSVATGVDGRFSIYAQAGAVTITVGGPATTQAQLAATAVANSITDLGVVALATLPAAIVAGNVAPTATASVTPTAVAKDGTVTVTATVTDADSAAADLRVTAYATLSDGTLLSSAPLAVAGATWTGPLTLPNPTKAAVSATIAVGVSDAKSGRSVTVRAGSVDIGG